MVWWDFKPIYIPEDIWPHYLEHVMSERFTQRSQSGAGNRNRLIHGLVTVAPSRAERGVAAILDWFRDLCLFIVDKGSRHLVLWSLGNLTGLSEILRQGTGCVNGRY